MWCVDPSDLPLHKLLFLQKDDIVKLTQILTFTEALAVWTLSVASSDFAAFVQTLLLQVFFPHCRDHCKVSV